MYETKMTAHLSKILLAKSYGVVQLWSTEYLNKIFSNRYLSSNRDLSEICKHFHCHSQNVNSENVYNLRSLLVK